MRGARNHDAQNFTALKRPKKVNFARLDGRKT
jgi:hypothetical protein